VKELPQQAITVPDPMEELLKEWLELGAFGVDWVRTWVPHARERLIEIVEVLRRFPWMVDVVRQRPVNNPHPYMLEVYVVRDGSEACISLNPAEGFLRPKQSCEGDKAGARVQQI
jgi:hypothetical protein